MCHGPSCPETEVHPRLAMATHLSAGVRVWVAGCLRLGVCEGPSPSPSPAFCHHESIITLAPWHSCVPVCDMRPLTCSPLVGGLAGAPCGTAGVLVCPLRRNIMQALKTAFRIPSMFTAEHKWIPEMVPSKGDPADVITGMAVQQGPTS